MMHRASRVAALATLLALSAQAARANAVLEWNEIMQETLGRVSPMHEGLYAGITQLAVFEAVNAITREYQPYLKSIDAPDGASPEAAAIAAAHDVLRHYVPDAADKLAARRTRSLEALLDGQAKEDGIAVGAAAARALIELRKNDGSNAPPGFHQPASDRPGEWQKTASCAKGGILPQWGTVRPLALKRPNQFRLPPPPSLRSDRYARNFDELERVGGANSTQRPQDRVDVVRFYAAVLAVRTWNPVTAQVAAARGDSITQTARALALVNVAISDALVAVFDTKYRYTFWRPETAIPAGDRDGNGHTRADPGFKPFIATPCHPSYPSAHASTAYAARAVLERLYGKDGHAITLSSPAVPGVVLQYTSFSGITRDIDDARIYGGIHFRFDQEAGTRQGERIGAYVFRHHMRPLVRPSRTD